LYSLFLLVQTLCTDLFGVIKDPFLMTRLFVPFVYMYVWTNAIAFGFEADSGWRSAIGSGVGNRSLYQDP